MSAISLAISADAQEALRHCKSVRIFAQEVGAG